MKIPFRVIYITLLFVSCGSLGTKKNTQNKIAQQQITVVEYKDNFRAAYTVDGHTMIYKKDSLGNYAVYYAKFEDMASEYGQYKIKEKLVRVEVDSTMTILNSILNISGGVFCNKIENKLYKIYYFDENLNSVVLEQIEVPLVLEKSVNSDDEKRVKRIIQLLYNAYELSKSINNSIHTLDNTLSALEPVSLILTYDVVNNDKILSPKAQEHISKIYNAIGSLLKFHFYIEEKVNRGIELE